MDTAYDICPFCFCAKTNEKVCPHCGHWTGEAIRGGRELPVGTILNRNYQLGIVFCQDGFSITYLAYDTSRAKKVIIKEYYPVEVSGRGSDHSLFCDPNAYTFYSTGMGLFLQEAQALNRLNTHPDIVHVTDLFRENNTAYYVTENIEGRSLQQIISENGGHLFLKELRPIIVPVINTLEDLHQAGILHCDISPDNIFVTNDDTVRLINFGAAKTEMNRYSQNPAAGLNPGYAPLEQYSNSGQQGPWTDIYAIGAVIYYCLTGTKPPDAPKRCNGEEPVPLRSYGVKCKKQFEDTLLKAIALFIPDRWRNITEFKSSLYPDKKRTAVPKQRILKVAAIIFSILAAAAVIGSVLYFSKQKEIRIRELSAEKNQEFEQAIYHMANFEYVEAIDIFSSLGNFRGSDKYLIDCINLADETEKKYVSAQESMQAHEFDKAIEVFSSLGNYKDAHKYLIECKNMSGERENNYNTAINLLAGGQYEKAIEIFQDLGDYKDSELQLEESIYQYAIRLSSDGKNEQALKQFAKITDYRDTKQKVQQTAYMYAESLKAQGKYQEAIKQYEMAAGYGDSNQKIGEIRAETDIQKKYDYILAHRDRNDLTTYKYLKELTAANYRDSTAIFKDLYAWKFYIVVNQNSRDTHTDLKKVDKWHTWYYHLLIYGGEPNEKLRVTYKTYWPDGKTTSGSYSSLLGDGDHYFCSCYYLRPAYAAGGECTTEFFDANGTSLGQRTVSVVNN